MILSERLQSAGGLQGLTIADRRSSTTLAGALAARRDSALAERLHGRSFCSRPAASMRRPSR